MGIFSRREIGKLVAGGALYGVAQGRAGGGVPQTPLPPATYDVPSNLVEKLNAPLVPRKNAILRLLQNSTFKNDMLRMLAEQHREVTLIDPDLTNLRSLSPMAKVTFQRQRNIKRAYDLLTRDNETDPFYYDRPYSPMRNWFEDQVGKIMWGKK